MLHPDDWPLALERCSLFCRRRLLFENKKCTGLFPHPVLSQADRGACSVPPVLRYAPYFRKWRLSTMSRADRPMTGAERMRAYRDRKKHGKCTVLMEADKGKPMFAAFAATDAEQREMGQSTTRLDSRNERSRETDKPERHTSRAPAIIIQWGYSQSSSRWSILLLSLVYLPFALVLSGLPFCKLSQANLFNRQSGWNEGLFQTDDGGLPYCLAIAS